jgi:hypothetical protein
MQHIELYNTVLNTYTRIYINYMTNKDNNSTFLQWRACGSEYIILCAEFFFRVLRRTRTKAITQHVYLPTTYIKTNVSQTFHLPDSLKIVEMIADPLMKIKIKNNNKYNINNLYVVFSIYVRRPLPVHVQTPRGPRIIVWETLTMTI